MKEYWILLKWKHKGLQLINNWHEFKSEEWHLISFFRKYSSNGYEYYLGILGFQFRLLNYK